MNWSGLMLGVGWEGSRREGDCEVTLDRVVAGIERNWREPGGVRFEQGVLQTQLSCVMVNDV